MKDFLTCYLNLFKATVGTGLISYPITFYLLGYYTIIAIFISSLFSQLGFYFYLKTNKTHGPLSISNLALKYKYSWYIIAHAAVIIKGMIVCITYLMSIRDIYSILLFIYKNSTNNISNTISDTITNNSKKDNKNTVKIIVIIHTIMISPLITLRQLKYLNYTSLLGLTSTCYLLFLSVYRYFTLSELGSINKKLDLKEIIRRLPFFVFSFTAHQTILPLQNDYYNLSLSFFMSVVISVSVSVCVVYCLFGILTAKIFNMENESYNSLCFNVFPGDYLSIFSMVMYIIVLSASIPLQLIPCRDQLLEAYFALTRYFRRRERVLSGNNIEEGVFLVTNRDVSGTIDSEDNTQPLAVDLSDEELVDKLNNRIIVEREGGGLVNVPDNILPDKLSDRSNDEFKYIPNHILSDTQSGESNNESNVITQDWSNQVLSKNLNKLGSKTPLSQCKERYTDSLLYTNTGANIGGSMSALKKTENSEPDSITKSDSLRHRIICAFLILATILTIFILGIPITFFQTLTGGTSSTILCFMLPTALFYGLCWKKSNIYEKVGATLSFIYGWCVFGMFLVTLFV